MIKLASLLAMILLAWPSLASAGDWKATSTPEEKKLGHYRLLRTKHDLERELIKAIRARDGLGVRVLLKTFGSKLGFDANSAPEDQPATPWLHLAARVGSGDMIKSFVSFGADANAKDERGNTALHVATAALSKDTVQALLKLKTIDIDAKNNVGQPAVELALLSQNPGLLPVFAKAGAKLPETVAGKPLAQHLFESDNYVAIEAFFRKKADLERLIEKPAHSAAMYGAARVIKLLTYKYKYSLWEKDPKSNMNVAEVAIANSKYDLYKLFVDMDPKFAKYISPKFGQPIVIALSNGDLDFAETLFKLRTPLVKATKDKKIDFFARDGLQRLIDDLEQALKKGPLNDKDRKHVAANLARARKLAKKIEKVQNLNREQSVIALMDAVNKGPSEIPQIERLIKKSGLKLEELLEYARIYPFGRGFESPGDETWLTTKHDSFNFFIKLFGGFDAFDRFLRADDQRHNAYEFAACRALIADDIAAAKFLLKKLKTQEHVFCDTLRQSMGTDFTASAAKDLGSPRVAKMLAKSGRLGIDYRASCDDVLKDLDPAPAKKCKPWNDLRAMPYDERVKSQDDLWKSILDGNSLSTISIPLELEQPYFSKIDTAILMDDAELAKALLKKGEFPSVYYGRNYVMDATQTPVGTLSIACALKFKNLASICQEQAGKYPVITTEHARTALDWALYHGISPIFFSSAPASQQDALLKRVAALIGENSIPADSVNDVISKFLQVHDYPEYLDRLKRLGVLEVLVTKRPESINEVMAQVRLDPGKAIATVKKMKSLGIPVPAAIGEMYLTSDFNAFVAGMKELQFLGLDLSEPYAKSYGANETTLLIAALDQGCSGGANNDKKLLWLIKNAKISPLHADPQGKTFWDKLFTDKDPECVKRLVSQLIKEGFHPLAKRQTPYRSGFWPASCLDAGGTNGCPSLAILEEMRMSDVFKHAPATQEECQAKLEKANAEIIERSARVLEWVRAFAEAAKEIKASPGNNAATYDDIIKKLFWNDTSAADGSHWIESDLCCQTYSPRCYATQVAPNPIDELIRESLREPICAMEKNHRNKPSGGEVKTVNLELGLLSKPVNGKPQYLSMGFTPALIAMSRANGREPTLVVSTVESEESSPLKQLPVKQKIFLTLPLSDDNALEQLTHSVPAETLSAFALDSKENFMRAYYPTCVKYTDRWLNNQKQTEDHRVKTSPSSGGSGKALSPGAQKVN